VWADGRHYQGSWKQSKLHGQGTYRWPDGRMYEGNYEDDQKSGYGVYTWPDGKKYAGNWVNGKQHGEGFFTNSKGKTKKGVWQDGQRKEWLGEEAPADPQTGGNTLPARSGTINRQADQVSAELQ